MEQLFKSIFLWVLIFTNINALETSNEEEIKKLIGQTIILGFDGLEISKSLKKDIKDYNLGGIILFDRDYKSKKIKNIKNPIQVKTLIEDIQNYSKYKMLISIDQEGGLVSRLSSKNGFFDTLKAIDISKENEAFVNNTYFKLSKQISNLGINLNFAPVVDLDLNPQNKVISYFGRAYSKDPEKVIKYSKIYINQMSKNKISSVLKHFPGHGSSLEDSHQGFVDISNTWQKQELLPYKHLIAEKKVKAIMTAHVYNKYLDAKYPATLSKKINYELLRKKLGFKGVIISDDLQMKAITKHYTLKQTLELAINSGVNILLFGNQIADKNITLKEIVNTIIELIKEKKVDIEKIKKSNELINKLLKKV